MEDKIQIADTPELIEGRRLLTLKACLKLEVKGMGRSHGPSAYSRIKQEFGLKGSKQNVLTQFEALLREKGILR